MENGLFILFLSHLPGPLSFYTALENNTIFNNIFFGLGGGSFPPPPLQAPLVIYLQIYCSGICLLIKESMI